MDLKNLHTFIQTAQTGNFTKAAELLGYSQSSVSAQIKQLEEELGAQLFDRINHKIALTAKGQETLKAAYQIEAMLRDLSNDAIPNEELEGTVVINIGESVSIHILTNAFHEFHRLYPHIRLKLVESRIDDLLDGLKHNQSDFIIALGERIYSSEYVAAHEDRLHLSFIAGKNSPYATDKVLSIYDIADHPFILTESGMGYRLSMDRKLASMSIEIDPILEIGNTDTICQLVSQGNGISYLPDFAVERYLQQGSIVRLNVCDFSVETWEQVLYHKNKWVSPPLRAVIDFFSKPLSEY